MPASPTKSELITILRTQGETAAAALRALPASGFEEGRYENGWNGRQILAHVASIEWTYRRLFEVAQQASEGGQPAPKVSAAAEQPAAVPSEAASLPTRPAAGGIDSYNARQVEKRAEATAADLITEFETNRAATVAAVEAADDALLQIPIRSAGGVTGELRDVLRAVAIEHVAAHVADIAGDQRLRQ